MKLLPSSPRSTLALAGLVWAAGAFVIWSLLPRLHLYPWQLPAGWSYGGLLSDQQTVVCVRETAAGFDLDLREFATGQSVRTFSIPALQIPSPGPHGGSSGRGLGGDCYTLSQRTNSPAGQPNSLHVRCYDLRDGRELQRFDGSGSPHFQLSNVGRPVVASRVGSAERPETVFRVLDADVPSYRRPGWYRELAFSQGGRVIGWREDAATLSAWSADDGRELWAKPASAGPSGYIRTLGASDWFFESSGLLHDALTGRTVQLPGEVASSFWQWLSADQSGFLAAYHEPGGDVVRWYDLADGTAVPAKGFRFPAVNRANTWFVPFGTAGPYYVTGGMTTVEHGAAVKLLGRIFGIAALTRPTSRHETTVFDPARPGEEVHFPVFTVFIVAPGCARTEDGANSTFWQWPPYRSQPQFHAYAIAWLLPVAWLTWWRLRRLDMPANAGRS